MIISAVLLPNKDDKKVLTQASEQICMQVESHIQLGDIALPHITLVQFIVDNDICGALWRDVASYANQITELLATNIAIIVSAQYDQAWIELQFQKTPTLETLREEILASPFARQHQIHNQNIFRPHCTLGLIAGQNKPELQVGADITKRTYRGLRLAVGVNGEHFTFAQTRFQT